MFEEALKIILAPKNNQVKTTGAKITKIISSLPVNWAELLSSLSFLYPPFVFQIAIQTMIVAIQFTLSNIVTPNSIVSILPSLPLTLPMSDLKSSIEFTNLCMSIMIS